MRSSHSVLLCFTVLELSIKLFSSLLGTVLELSSLKKTGTVSVRVSEMAVGTTRYRRLVLCCTSVKGLFKCKVDDMHFMIKHFTRHQRARSLSQSTLRSARCPLHNLTAVV